MATLGALTVDISANVARLQKDVEGLRKEFGRMESGINDSSKSLDSMARGFKTLLGAAASLYTIQQAFQAVNAAAQFQQMEQGFNNLAASHGANAKQIVNSLKLVSDGTVSTAAIMESAGKAMLLGIPANQLDELMQIARSSAKVTGQTVQQAFNDIATGIGRQSKLILDNLGIIVSAEKAYEDYAQSIGKSASALTDAEKKQAFANATIKAGREIVERVGNTTETAAESIGRMQARFADLKIELSTQFLPVGVKVIEQLTKIGTAMSEVIKGYEYSQTPLGKIESTISSLRGVLKSIDEGKFLASEDAKLSLAKELNKALVERANLLKLEQQELIKTTQAAIAQQKAIKAAATASTPMQGAATFGAGSFNVTDQGLKAVQPGLQIPLSLDFRNLANVQGMESSIGNTLAPNLEEELKLSEELFNRQEEFENLQLESHIARLDTKHQAEIDYFKARVGITDDAFSALDGIEELASHKEQARFRIRDKAYQAMEDQMLSLIETGKFSVSAFAQIVAQQVKLELVGLAARAAIWAIYETAMGLRDLAIGSPTAAIHFASAAEFGSVAGGALVAAAGVQALAGGGAQRSEPGTVGGEPLITRPAAGLDSSAGLGEETLSTQNIYISIHTLTGTIDDKAQEEIVRAINEAGQRNVKIEAQAIGA